MTLDEEATVGSDTKERAKAIGTHLQAARKAAGFKSAKAFADHIGLSKDTYTGYEQGRISLSYERAWEFADALDCTLDALGGRKPPEHAYEDPGQAALNASYENMNESGKETLAAVARSMERDTANRIVNDRPERADGQTAMGA